MVEPLSPLGDAYRPGRHGAASGDPGVTISETNPGSIVQLAAWPGKESELLAQVAASTSLKLRQAPGEGVVEGFRSGFPIGPGRWLIVDQAEGLGAALASAIPSETGAATDLTHGRTGIRVAGPSVEKVLSKLIAVDFAPSAFPVGRGCATMHHDFFVAMQRSAPDGFDLYVYRSLARAFWKTLAHAAAEYGYLVK